ncbi:hypothetical protein [[Clostridium] colinum]|uniref:hypothetical protein n=1 Tax=[Clostridium] colinum TaxID=36835 RepID=UPI0020241CFD|nr:hypothetical protein [[Clostridium] colinum]
MKSIKIKSIILLLITILYIFLMPNKYNITTIIVNFYDLPSLLIAIIVPLVLILIKKQSNSFIENINIPISILFAIYWSFSLSKENLFLTLLPIIYGLAVSILISIINLQKHKLSFTLKIGHR